MNTVAPPSVELVLLTQNNAAGLEADVDRLREALGDRLTGPWMLTIADQGSTDGSWAVAERVSATRPQVRAVQLGDRLDRRQLRKRWNTSPATVVAFADVSDEADLDTLLAPLTVTPVVVTGAADTLPMTRRVALATLGGAGLALLLAACGSSKTKTAAATTTTSSTTAPSSTSTTAAAASSTSSTSSASTTASTATSATTGTPTALATEMTEGPYYLDLNLVRSDVTEDRKGTPLGLTLAVVTASGAPVSGASVDIWHCDADGLYSGFASQSASANQGGSSAADSGTFLRGTQVTDSTGKATFKTIYPGFYQGRTVHIHVKVHVSGREVHTGQLFFDDAFTDTVFASTAPYSSRSARTTRNNSDSIYRGGGASSTLNVQKSGSSYSSALTMAVRTA